MGNGCQDFWTYASEQMSDARSIPGAPTHEDTQGLLLTAGCRSYSSKHVDRCDVEPRSIDVETGHPSLKQTCFYIVDWNRLVNGNEPTLDTHSPLE